VDRAPNKGPRNWSSGKPPTKSSPWPRKAGRGGPGGEPRGHLHDRCAQVRPVAPSLQGRAAAYVIGRRALGFEEKLPKGYKALLKNGIFYANAQGFYSTRLQELQKLKEAEKNPYLKRRLSREMGKARRALSLLLSFPGPQRSRKASFQGSPGGQKGSTSGRNSSGANPWRVLRVGLFLPLLGLEVPRDLSPLKPILLGSWERWKRGRDPHPGGGSACRNVRFG
jgi:hypothetical protein